MNKEKLSPVEDETGLVPLRVDDLISFFSARDRSLACPYCPHEGGWEMALHMVEKEDESNPLLVIFPNTSATGTVHSSCGLTCPNCGHFAFVSTYKIRQYLREVGKEHG